MKYDTTFKLRGKLRVRVVDAFRRAISFGLEASALHQLINGIIAEDGASLPTWAKEYLRGYSDALYSSLYENHLIFLFIAPDGSLIDTKNMPEGWSHQRICEENLPSGHFWKHNLNPYYPGKRHDHPAEVSSECKESDGADAGDTTASGSVPPAGKVERSNDKVERSKGGSRIRGKRPGSKKSPAEDGAVD